MKISARYIVGITALLTAFTSSVVASQKTGVWSDPPTEFLTVQSEPGSTPHARAVSLKVQFDVLKSHREHPSSPRLFALLGQQLYAQGYFHRAMECYQMGWDTYKGSTEHDIKIFADLCGAELAQMYARVGRMDDLQRFLEESKDRDFLGPASTLIDQSYQGLRGMKVRPEIAFKCGPYALQSILRHNSLDAARSARPAEAIEKAASTTSGFSLFEVAELSRQTGQNYKAYQKDPGAPVIYPAVVHWKLDHFAAILEKSGERYRIADPTFGKDLWITEDALNEECSGYFLLPEGNYPGYTAVEETQAKSVRGKGFTNSQDPNANGNDDLQTCPTPPPPGMPGYSIHLMAASLRLTDTPVGYSPPYGPDIPFTLKYNQRDAYNTAIYNVSSFGHQWTFDWFSFLRFDPGDLYSVSVGTPGGGGVTYSGDGAGNYSISDFGQSSFHLSSGSAPIATRTLEDGTQQVYSHEVSVLFNESLLLLTKIVDPHGHEVNIVYDTHNRIQKVVDAAGGESIFCYDENGSGHCQSLIRSITDPYGRTAYFEYDGLSRLVKIRDILGLESTFTYSGYTSFINKMTTPYGDTVFEKEPYNPSLPYDRYIEVTDPEGGRERVESIQSIDPNITHNLYDEKWPDYSAIDHDRSYHQYRNTFYWDKRAMQEPVRTFANATIYHFLHTSNWDKTSRLVEYIKRPLEGLIVYQYPYYDDHWGWQLTTLTAGENTIKSPARTARLLDNGETQLTQVNYNLKGRPVEIIDPAGRRQTIEYAANGLDPIARKVEVASTLQTVSQVTYDGNRRPVTFTDAAGEVSTVAYHPTWGLPTSITNALSETYTIDYTTTGLLKRIVSPNPNNYIELAYGAYDNVTSVTYFPEAYTLQYEYDVFDRVTKVIYPDSTSEKYIYDRLDLIATRDRMNQWSHTTYDDNQRPIVHENANGEIMEMIWCGCGALQALKDGEGRMTTYEYDVQGRLTTETLPATNPKLYEYEPLSGRLAGLIDPKGQKRRQYYNIDNTIAAKWVENVAVNTLPVAPVYYDWDADLRRVTAWGDNIGTTTLTYYPIGSLGAGKMASWDAPGADNTLTYTYDELGRGVQTKLHTTVLSDYTYNNLGQVVTDANALDTFTYTYQPNSRIPTGYSSVNGPSTAYTFKGAMDDFMLDKIVNRDSSSNIDSQFEYDFDVLGRITNWKQSIGNLSLDQEFLSGYDAKGQMTELIVDDATPQLPTWNWQFDKAGNRINEQLSTSVGIKRQAHTINARDQIESIISGGAVHLNGQLDRPGMVEDATPPAKTPTDGAGNFAAWIATNSLTSATVTAHDFSSNVASQAKAITAVNATEYEFEYDDNGNMIEMTVVHSPGGYPWTTYYFWDALDRLVAIESDFDSTGITYDGLGRMMSYIDVHMGSPETYNQFTWNGLSPVRKNGYVVGDLNETFYFKNGFQYSSSSEVYGDSGPYYTTTDHLGSVRGLYDSSGTEIDAFSYDAYGNFDNGTFSNVLLDNYYTGHLYHAVSGLYLAPYRAYNPKLGRWLSREPLGLDGPNLYHYVFGDPLNKIDPTGLKWCYKLLKRITHYGDLKSDKKGIRDHPLRDGDIAVGHWGDGRYLRGDTYQEVEAKQDEFMVLPFGTDAYLFTPEYPIVPMKCQVRDYGAFDKIHSKFAPDEWIDVWNPKKSEANESYPIGLIIVNMPDGVPCPSGYSAIPFF